MKHTPKAVGEPVSVIILATLAIVLAIMGGSIIYSKVGVQVKPQPRLVSIELKVTNDGSWIYGRAGIEKGGYCRVNSHGIRFASTYYPGEPLGENLRTQFINQNPSGWETAWMNILVRNTGGLTPGTPVVIIITLDCNGKQITLDGNTTLRR